MSVRPTIENILMSTRLLVTAGSGGVGKTTMAAALAIRAAKSGRKVAVITIDPAKRLAQALGLDDLTGELKTVFLDKVSTLSAMMLDVKKTSDLMVEQFAENREAARRILANSYYQQFSAAVAGSQEYMALEQVRILLDEHRFDLVVLDTPPAVHALDFLDAPQRLLKGLKNIPLKSSNDSSETGLKSRLAARGRGLVLTGLNRLTGGPFIEDLAEFIGAFSSILIALETAAVRVDSLLRQPTTQFFLVATPTETQLQDAMTFRNELEKRQLPFCGFIINRVHEGLMSRFGNEENVLNAIHSEVRRRLIEGDADMLSHALFRSYQRHQQFAERDAELIASYNLSEKCHMFVVPKSSQDIHTLDGMNSLAMSMCMKRNETSD